MRWLPTMLFFAAVVGPSTVYAESDTTVYATACRVAIGKIPAFSCADGMPVPITADGAPVNAKPGLECDRPALLDNGPGSDGQCVPNSRILSLSTPSAQITVMCRQKHIRSSSSLLFDEIDVIAHNPATGATCWFQALGDKDAPVEGRAPSPTQAADNRYWRAPRDVAATGCGLCHDAGPFVFSPFVGQVWDQMPVDPFGPYFHVDPRTFGFSAWPTSMIAPRDNACLGCHRIGVGASCGSLTLSMTGRATPVGADTWAKSFLGSHAMPPGFTESPAAWEGIYAASVDQIHSCCENPDQAFCSKSLLPRN
jgi:hypothetical protein